MAYDIYGLKFREYMEKLQNQSGPTRLVPERWACLRPVKMA